MTKLPWHYNFEIANTTHLHSIRGRLIEESPTVEGVRVFIQELYEQRLLEATHLFMAQQDLAEMSKKFIGDRMSYPQMPYFSDTNEDLHYPGYNGLIKRIFHANGVTRVIALPDLEHRSVIAGFFGG